MDGPARCASTTTSGVSVIPAIPRASTIREKPPPLVAVIDRTPANDAPIAMWIAASSSSACFTTTPSWAECAASQCMIDDAGVIGYWERNFRPAAAAPSAIASLPLISSFGAPRRERAREFTLACCSANR